jgi:acetyl esterase/lipase
MSLRRIRAATCARSVFVAWLLAACGSGPPSPDSYQARRAAFQTELLYEARASLTVDDTLPDLATLFPGVAGTFERIRYPSGDMMLDGWLYRPPRASDRLPPALLYLHPGHALRPTYLPGLRPLLEAGFVVMWPTYRGEHGNPGSFEEMYGEVDDAAAAARWLAGLPGIDRERIYGFGWSIGGGISALLALREDVPLRHTGSSGGLYGPEILRSWAAGQPRVDGLPPEPFDADRPGEVDLRALTANFEWMKRPHYAYIETNSSFWNQSIAAALRARDEGNNLIHVIMVPGDHFTAFPHAVRRYLELIMQ